jgi:hypothetical protein
MQNFDVLIRPPNLKPIEHVWALVKRKLREYPTPTKGILQLGERVETSFHSITHAQYQRSIIACPIVSKMYEFMRVGE